MKRGIVLQKKYEKLFIHLYMTFGMRELKEIWRKNKYKANMENERKSEISFLLPLEI
jgi:hypothetical protein